MKCPKCHFEQPQDNYCANCGIEIANYHPPKIKLARRIMSHSNLAILFVLAVAAAVAKTFFLSQSPLAKNHLLPNSNRVQVGTTSENSGRPNLKGQIPKNESNNSQSATGPVLTENPHPQDSSQDVIASNDQNPLPNTNPGKGEHRMNQGPTDPKASGRTLAASANKSSISFKISYAEISISDLPRVYEEAQSTDQFTSYSDHSVGVLLNYGGSNFEKKSRINVYFSEERTLELGKTQQWFVGASSPSDGSQFGLIFNLELNNNSEDISNGIHTATLDIARSWRDVTDPSLVNVNFPPITFKLEKSGALFVSGLIPHRVVTDMEERLAAIDALKILRFSPFLKQQTESIIIIQFVDKSL